MHFIDKTIQLSTLFPFPENKDRKKIKNITIKVIPEYLETEQRIMERKKIFNAYNIFQNESKKAYPEHYLSQVFNNLHKNKRNYSFERNKHYNDHRILTEQNDTKPLPLLTKVSSNQKLKLRTQTKHQSVNNSIDKNNNKPIPRNHSYTHLLLQKKPNEKKYTLKNKVPYA